jgi:hypothetical protein
MGDAMNTPSGEPKSYRPGATLIPLFIWAVGLGCAGYFALQVAFNNPPAPEARGFAYLMVVFSILFGPIAFLAVFVRYCRVFVTLDPTEGLLLSGGRKIPWSEISSINFKESAFTGALRVSPILFIFSFGCIALLYFVVLPSVALFTPWHRRVVVTLADRTILVFRDLTDAPEFVAQVSQRIASPEAEKGKEEPRET